MSKTLLHTIPGSAPPANPISWHVFRANDEGMLLITTMAVSDCLWFGARQKAAALCSTSADKVDVVPCTCKSMCYASHDPDAEYVDFTIP